MKTNLLRNTLAAIATLFISMFALPHTARAQTMKLLGTQYTDDAVVNIGGGTATWDNASTTLTLDGINVESHEGFFLVCKDIPDMKIVLLGNNSVNSTAQTIDFNSSNIHISGTGSLTARSGYYYAITQQGRYATCTLTFKDCTLDVQGKNSSIVGYWDGSNTERLTLVVDNATLKVKGDQQPAIKQLLGYELKQCYITTPGVKFGRESPGSSSYCLVGENDAPYVGEVEFVPDTPNSVSQISTAVGDTQDTYNLAGQHVGDDYKGIVIENGKKILRK